MDLHEALAQISEIRQQVAQTQTFRGYRAAPVAFSGVVACLAAGALVDLLQCWDFASYRLLPKATFWVGVFYMTAGVLCLLLARGDFAFSPWAMGVPFGLGQFLSAGILYWTLERNSDEQEKAD